MNKPLLEQPLTDTIEVIIHRVEAAEVDEMWSYVGKKKGWCFRSGYDHFYPEAFQHFSFLHVQI